ncbi:MAG: hypothetical protein ACSHXW_17350 [Yoonia sp.]
MRDSKPKYRCGFTATGFAGAAMKTIFHLTIVRGLLKCLVRRGFREMPQRSIAWVRHSGQKMVLFVWRILVQTGVYNRTPMGLSFEI